MLAFLVYINESLALEGQNLQECFDLYKEQNKEILGNSKTKISLLLSGIVIMNDEFSLESSSCCVHSTVLVNSHSIESVAYLG